MSKQEVKKALTKFVTLLNTGKFNLSIECKSKIKELITFWNSGVFSVEEFRRIDNEVHSYINTELKSENDEIEKIWFEYFRKMNEYRYSLSQLPESFRQEIHESIIASTIEKVNGNIIDHCVICGDTDNLTMKHGKSICSDCVNIQTRMYGM